MRPTPYADIRTLKPNQTVYLDRGFTCVDAGPVQLFLDHNGELCFTCACGTHNLDGQCDNGINCVGVYTEPNDLTLPKA